VARRKSVRAQALVAAADFRARPFTVQETTMSQDEREDNTIYKVVVNHEEQYSIWPADRENALGWRDAGKQGTKAECLAYIEEVWTDMRPLSLRKKMEESGG
jgi:MbtH protein